MYERINLVREGSQSANSSPKTLKLGRKNANGNPLCIEQWTAKLSNVESRKLKSENSSSFKSRGPEASTKIGFIEILSSCKTLLQPSGLHKEELYPTVGFIDDS